MSESNSSENRVSIVSIILEDPQASEEVNRLLHGYASRIIGRMGIPYGEKGISVICVVLDAPPATVSALSGKLGMIKGVAAKTVTSKF